MEADHNISNFSLDKSIALLGRTPSLLKSWLYELNFGWDEVNEGPGTWSAYDVLGHLIHGEKTDWIPRARIILDEQARDTSFEPFDRFAQFELSEGKAMDQLLVEFEALRMANLKTLQSWKLGEEQLNLTGLHPDLGTVTLRQLLATWTIHDMGHIHQISRVLVKHYAADVGPWSAYIGVLGGK